MLYLIWAISLCVSFWLGYKLRELTTKIEVLQEAVKDTVKKEKVNEPTSELIDVYDPVKEAMYEHEKVMKELNE